LRTQFENSTYRYLAARIYQNKGRTIEAKRWYARWASKIKKSAKVIVDVAELSIFLFKAAGDAATAVKMSSSLSPLNFPTVSFAAEQNALN
jgi:hypothetical protein